MDFVILFIIAAVVGFFAFSDMIQDWKAEDADDEAFERSRQRRQEEFDRHWQAVCRAELMSTCETIYVGRVHHD